MGPSSYLPGRRERPGPGQQVEVSAGLLGADAAAAPTSGPGRPAGHMDTWVPGQWEVSQACASPALSSLPPPGPHAGLNMKIQGSSLEP